MTELGKAMDGAENREALKRELLEKFGAIVRIERRRSFRIGAGAALLGLSILLFCAATCIVPSDADPNE